MSLLGRTSLPGEVRLTPRLPSRGSPPGACILRPVLWPRHERRRSKEVMIQQVAVCIARPVVHRSRDDPQEGDGPSTGIGGENKWDLCGGARHNEPLARPHTSLRQIRVDKLVTIFREVDTAEAYLRPTDKLPEG